MLCTIVSDRQLNVTVQSVGEITILLSWTEHVFLDDTVLYYQVMTYCMILMYSVGDYVVDSMCDIGVCRLTKIDVIMVYFSQSYGLVPHKVSLQHKHSSTMQLLLSVEICSLVIESGSIGLIGGR